MKKIILLAFVLVLLSTVMIGRFIRPVEASGTIYIKADGSIDPTTANITSTDNVTYTFADNINDSIVVERDNIVVDGAGYTLQGTGSGSGFNLTGINNITIKNTNIKGFRTGIYLNSTSSSVIYGNNITDNGFGIRLYDSSYITISGNDIKANAWWCIQLKDSSNHNSISGNNLTNTISGSGMSIEDSLNNDVSGNIIANNSIGGIWLGIGSSSNIISGNVITNKQYGIWLYSTSDNNIIGNNITNNGDGIHLSGYSNNVIYHNNFINNTKQFLVYTPGYTNFWDDGYPSGGNYWSDYVATANDTHSGPFQNEPGSDGIGDRPYIIDVDNQDGYPLMGPISFFNACTWDEITYYVHTVSNSTVSDFYFSEDDKLISFNVTGADGTVGFCRVTIPNEFLWCDTPEQWQVWVNNTLIEDRKIIEDTNYTYIYFTYNQSTQNVEVIGVHVIPEFPTWTSMLLILIVLTVAIAIHKRRLKTI